tara:strand:- start:358 stop:534 length:177 start_codon:yes stop_codon:yes gene_type:complete
MNKAEKKLLKLQVKAQKCLTHKKALKILRKESKILTKKSEVVYITPSGPIPPWPHELF